MGSWSGDDVAGGIIDYLVCVEMVFFSIAHMFTFTYREYLPEDMDERRRSGIVGWLFEGIDKRRRSRDDDDGGGGGGSGNRRRGGSANSQVHLRECGRPRPCRLHRQ